jgi:hypothetical protein
MDHETVPPHTWRDWLPIALGALLALGLLQYVRSNWLVKLEEAALGTETQNVFVSASGGRVLCQDARDGPACIADYDKANRPPAVLWLGNSQHAAINRYKPGDATSPALLHDAVRPRGPYVVTYAQPNSNLHEHALIFPALAGQYNIKALVLPVYLYKIREQGVRASVAQYLDEAAARRRVEGSRVWPLLAPLLRAQSNQAGADGHGATLQARIENSLDQSMSAASPLWAARANLRGLSSVAIHTLRNKVLGINSQTKRRVDNSVYLEKLAVLEAMLTDARAQGIAVLLYIPPYRLDLPGPYYDDEYRRLKADLQALAARYGATYLDIGNIVPGPEWGFVTDSLFGFREPDFIHFTGEGHVRHAAAIDAALQRMGL